MESVEIKQIREDLILSQQEFADKLRVDKGTVSRWERGEQRPRAVTIRRILRLKRKGVNV